MCETELEEMSSNNDIANYLIECLHNRKKKILVQNRDFLAALYLDPRFCYRGSIFLTDEKKRVAIVSLNYIYVHTYIYDLLFKLS